MKPEQLKSFCETMEPKPKKNRSTGIFLRISKQDKQALQKLAKKEGITISDYIRKSIVSYVKALEGIDG